LYLVLHICQRKILIFRGSLADHIIHIHLFVTTRLPEAGPTYAWQLSRTIRISPQTNNVFPAHFVLTHAHPGRTSRSVTHRSKSSTLNFGVFSDGLPEKKLQLVGMSILINSIKPWAGMSHYYTSLGRLAGKVSSL
jgi:hypothetical protein